MCFRWSAFMINCISAYKSQITFMGFDFEDDKLRIKPELRVMMAENQTQSKSKWTEHETIPRDTFFPANQDETSHVNEH